MEKVPPLELPQEIARREETDELRLWAEVIVKLVHEQRQQLEAQQQHIENLLEELRKLKSRNASNSSVPPSSDQLKKRSAKTKEKSRKKRGPKYDHPGSTRNGFGQPDKIEIISVEKCPSCEGAVSLIESAPSTDLDKIGQPCNKADLLCYKPIRQEGCPILSEIIGPPEQVQQVAELVIQPVEIREYHRRKHQCLCCGWSGCPDLPWGVKPGFSYGARRRRLGRVVGIWWQPDMAETGIRFRTHPGSPYIPRKSRKNAQMVSRKPGTKLRTVANLGATARCQVCR